MKKFKIFEIEVKRLALISGGVDFGKTLTNCETGETLQPRNDKDPNAGSDERRCLPEFAD